jgi:histidinol-phosphate aminotransferase
LIGRGIVLRPMAGYGLPQCLRATVGTRADNLHLLDALDGLSG